MNLSLFYKRPPNKQVWLKQDRGNRVLKPFRRLFQRRLAKSNEVDVRYDMRLPTRSNALDIFKGQWSAAIPGFGYGSAALTESPHVKFFERQIGGFLGKKILELGPLEASHTYMMFKGGADHIVAIEANKNAFLKCLIIKELLSIERATFLLGDFCQYLKSNSKRYDAILASGVLYHMLDPLGLIEFAANASDFICVWTHYFDRDRIRSRPELARKFSEKAAETIFHGRRIQLYEQRYFNAVEWDGFCGGAGPTSRWMTKDGIIRAFNALGFEVTIGAEQADHPHGPAFWFVGKRLRDGAVRIAQ